MDTYGKDPDAVLDYKVNWADWLATGETITTSTFTVPAGLTKDSEDNDGTSATVWLSGGTAGSIVTVTNEITTNQGRTDDRSFNVSVYER